MCLMPLCTTPATLDNGPVTLRGRSAGRQSRIVSTRSHLTETTAGGGSRIARSLSVPSKLKIAVFARDSKAVSPADPFGIHDILQAMPFSPELSPRTPVSEDLPATFVATPCSGIDPAVMAAPLDASEHDSPPPEQRHAAWMRPQHAWRRQDSADHLVKTRSRFAFAATTSRGSGGIEGNTEGDDMSAHPPLPTDTPSIETRAAGMSAATTSPIIIPKIASGIADTMVTTRSSTPETPKWMEAFHVWSDDEGEDSEALPSLADRLRTRSRNWAQHRVLGLGKPRGRPVGEPVPELDLSAPLELPLFDPFGLSQIDVWVARQIEEEDAHRLLPAPPLHINDPWPRHYLAKAFLNELRRNRPLSCPAEICWLSSGQPCEWASGLDDW